jgi:hypothetical protein
MDITTHWLRLVVIGLSLCVALTSCVAWGGFYDTDVGYDTDVKLGYSPGYIEPYGYAVGGWGGGYQVGPGRGGDHRQAAASRRHSYRRAASSRATPSIPSNSRRGEGRDHQ